MRPTITLLMLACFVGFVFSANAQPPQGGPPPGPPPEHEGHRPPPPQGAFGPPPPPHDGFAPPPPPHDGFGPPPPPPGGDFAPPPPPDGFGPPPGDQPGPPELQRADTNGDGQISFQELKALRPQITQDRFDLLDRNKDGVLSRADGPPPGGPGPGGRGPGEFGERPGGLSDEQRAEFMQSLDALLELDTNEDGQVTFAEVTAAKPGFPEPNFRRVDVDRNNALDAEDRRLLASVGRGPQGEGPERGPGREGRRGGGRLMERLANADANGDAKISFAEAQTAMPRLDQQMFNWYDRNGDGFLSREDREEGGVAPRPQQ